MRRWTWPARPRREAGVVASEALLAAYVALITVLVTGPMSDWGWSRVTTDGDKRAVTAVAAASVVLVLLRHRLPAVAVVAAALLFGRYLEAGVAVAVIAYGANNRIPSVRRRMAAIALAVVAPATVAAIANNSSTGWRALGLVIALETLVCVVIPAVVGTLQAQRERLVTSLRARTSHLEHAQQMAANAARLQERSRVAQEMHDVLGHRLSLISLYAGALELEAVQAAPQLHAEAQLVRRTARTALDEMRSVLGILRGGQREQTQQLTRETGTRADLQRLVDESTAAGVNVQLSWSGGDLDDLDPPLRAAVHRLVREGLTNVHKHAPRADVRVLVGRLADRVRVEVRNGPDTDRRTATQPGDGRGLVGLQERVRLLGGALDAGPIGTGGFGLRAQLPLTDEARPSLTGGAEPIGTNGSAPVRPSPQPPGGTQRPGESPSRAATMVVRAAGVLSVAGLMIATVEFAVIPSPVREPHVRVGMTKEAVRYLVGDSEPVAQLAARGREPAVPVGATCWYVEGDTSADGHSTFVYRYCFRDGRLIEKVPLRLTVSGR